MPIWSGSWLWRGAVEWPVFREGDTMIVAGGMGSRFVCYPIHRPPARPHVRLTNWAVMARLNDAAMPPRQRADWNRYGDRDEALSFVRDRFRLAEIDPVSMIGATAVIYEYPNCDRDPLPRWSFGPVTLLGDAAHPMYPVGSNGASQAILDARALARHLSARRSAVDALAEYDAERRPFTTEIVKMNRRGGNERVIDLVEARAPEGFDDLESIAPLAERSAIVTGYSQLAGFSPDQVNRR
jgi:5-methylphenazine-1-carboxylate 1-monooxygenase